MAFNYSKASSHSVIDGNKYFLDSNIWLKILQPKVSPKYKDSAYLKLFDKIISNNKVKIVLPSLVISEVINRILRDVYMAKFIRKNPQLIYTDSFYKDVFRPSLDFKIAYNLICDEITNYHSSIELINDTFGSDIKFKHVLKDPPQNFDFNDYYYFRLCKNNNFILVTDDKDFWSEDITVLTMSDTLNNKYIAHLVAQNKT